MCGIAGIVNWSGEPVDQAVVRRMIRTLAHRGPDADGVFIDGAMALGHTRLSVIDVEGGSQPMALADRPLCITFNGEVFNFVELREELQSRGHRFATRSDTEVVLRAYAQWGERCVDRFNGQWAFAIWDSQRGTVFLSRDRVGIAPLFYALAGDSFLFASEIKGLLAHPRVRRGLDVQGLAEAFTFWAPLAPRTAFRDVRELPPGCSMTVSATGVVVKRYWTLEFDADSPERSEGEYAETLLSLLRDATRLRLRSDVPVGAYLSGGLDSTVVTSLAVECTQAPLETFSVTFADGEFDESGFQREAVEFLGTTHNAVACGDGDIAEAFPDVVWHAEAPLLRTGPAPLFRLAQSVRRRGYKVVLTGEGSDEILGGYDLFKEAKIRSFCARRPESRLRPALLKRLYPYLPQVQAQSTAYLKGFFNATPAAAADPFFSHLPRWNSTSRLKLLLSEDVRQLLADYDPLAELRAKLPARFFEWDLFSRAQYLETSMLLPGYILSSQGDRMVMAHGVEARFPFLDHRVIEFASRVPAHLKMRVLDEKYLLKRAVRGLVPDSIRRRKKQPYRAPESKAFVKRTGHGTSGFVEEVLSPAAVADGGVFAPRAVQHLVDKVRALPVTTARDEMAFIGVLSTQMLIDQFVRGSRIPS